MAGVMQLDGGVGDDTGGVNEDGTGDCDTQEQDNCVQEYVPSVHQDCVPDDLLPPLIRLEKYVSIESFKRDRNVVGRVIVDTLRLVADNPEDVSYVLALLSRMSHDEESAIRSELMDHVPHIAMLCHVEKEKLLHVVVDHLLLLVTKLLMDEDNQVRKAAQVTLLVLMDQALVPQSALEDIVCPVVLQLTEDNQAAGAVQLMSKMAPHLGAEATEQLFLKRFCELCQDPVFYVRKMCASSFGEICAVVDQETTENVLLPRFVDLCRDDAWAVRKGCADVIMSVSCACSLELRKTALAPVFVTLLWDVVRWVRSSAFRTLGPFISTFAVPSVADLAYNENGELVLMNRVGCEFSRFNSNMDRAEAERLEEAQRCEEAQDVSLSEDMIWLRRNSRHKNTMPRQRNQLLIPVYERERELVNMVFEENHKAFQQSQNEAAARKWLPELMGEGTCVFSQNDNGDFVVYSDSGLERKDIHCYTPDEEPETQETDLDEDLDNKTEADDISSNGSTPLSTPTAEWDFNSFQFWRVPIPDVEIPCLEGEEETVYKLENCSLAGQIHSTQQAESMSSDYLNKSQDNFSLHYSDNDSRTANLDETMTMNAESVITVPPQNIVPQELVEQFVAMTDPPLAHVTDEISHHCAYSLPAVALTLGRENWGFLRGTYKALAGDMQWKVRRTVASSIHELAEILGEELATKDLVPIYNGFIKDLDEVRIGALKHLADFLKLLPPLEQESFLPKFMEFLKTDNEWNWRYREELAQQLLQVIALYTPQDACTHLKPIAITLLKDKVAAVRTVSLELVTQLVHHVTAETALLRQLLPQLAEEFAHSTRWERRQTFALLCSHLVSGRVLDGEQFAREVMHHLLDLSWDPVPNVRLAVARTLASDMMAHQFFSNEQSPHQEVLLQVLKRLNNDKDRDVRYFAVPRVK